MTEDAAAETSQGGSSTKVGTTKASAKKLPEKAPAKDWEPSVGEAPAEMSAGGMNWVYNPQLGTMPMTQATHYRRGQGPEIQFPAGGMASTTQIVNPHVEGVKYQMVLLDQPDAGSFAFNRLFDNVAKASQGSSTEMARLDETQKEVQEVLDENGTLRTRITKESTRAAEAGKVSEPKTADEMEEMADLFDELIVTARLNLSYGLVSCAESLFKRNPQAAIEFLTTHLTDQGSK